MLYISDLDGTLLDSKAQLSPYSAEKLNSLIENGIHFTVASARSIVAMIKILKGVKLKLPVIEFNGAFLSDFKSGRHLVINDIKPDICLEIYNCLTASHILPFISTFSGTEDCLYYSKLVNGGQEWYYNSRVTQKDERLRHLHDLSCSLSDRIVCFTLIDTKEVLTEVRDKLQERYGEDIQMYLSRNIYTPEWFWLTIHSEKAVKSKAIVDFKNRFGYSSHRLTVFGDDVNDISMFRIADRSVAVSNADEEVKQHADVVIGPNTKDSVVDFILSDTQRDL